MNTSLYSFWLCPSQEDSQYLGTIINNLSNEFKSTPFSPHITLYGIVLLSKENGIEIINTAAQSHHPISVEMEYLASSEDFFKTVYLQIKQKRELVELQDSIKKCLKTHIDYLLSPHISLIYHSLLLDQKKHIKETLQLKPAYTMSTLALVYLGEKESDVYNVAGWRIDYIKPLE